MVLPPRAASIAGLYINIFLPFSLQILNSALPLLNTIHNLPACPHFVFLQIFILEEM